jgi:hypothetical protein
MTDANLNLIDFFPNAQSMDSQSHGSCQEPQFRQIIST